MSVGLITIKQLEAMRAKLHANVDDAIIPLIRAQGCDPIDTGNDVHGLILTIDGGMTMPVPDAWIEYWAHSEFSGCGLDWVLKYAKDCCEATANEPKYQKTHKGARRFMQNWLKNAKAWADDRPAIEHVGDKFERKN